MEGEGVLESPPLPSQTHLTQELSHHAPSRIRTNFRGEDLGKGQTSCKKFTPSQTHPPQELSHHTPSKISAEFDLCHGRSAVGISFLGWVCFYFVADVLILSSKLLLFGADRVVGTCGAAWNSLFVLRKLSSSHHDFLIPREVTLIGRGFRVAVPKSLRELFYRL